MARRGIRKNSIFGAIGYGVPVLATLVFTPLLLHSMGPSEFGLWMLSTSFLGLMGVFDLGLSTAIAKYVAQYHQQGDIDRMSATATMGLLIYLAIGLLLAVPVYLLAPKAASLFHSGDVPRDVIAGTLRLAAFGLIPLLLKNAGLAVSIGLQRFDIPMIASVAQSTLTLAVAYAVTRQGGSVTQVVISSLITLWIIAVVSALIGYRMLHSLRARLLFSRTQARLMMRFTALASMSGLGILLFSVVDRILVGILLGASAVAYYAVSVGIAANLVTIASALTHPLMPAASSWSSSGQWDRSHRYLARSTLAIAILELALASVLLLLSGPFMDFWLGPDLATHTLTPFRILIVAYAVISLNSPAYHIANGSGFPRIPAVGAIAGGALTVLLILVLARPWGLAGAALANTGYWATLLIPVLTSHALKRRSRRSQNGRINVEARTAGPAP